MTRRILIDAIHPEETRVAVVEGRQIQEFDFVTSTKSQIKGNIYLAKVTRVEPSLQAAFVEYGGNRQGFLPFAEIHPDYYQIPVADRQQLLDEEEAEEDDIAAEAESSVHVEGAAMESAPVAEASQGDEEIETLASEEEEERSRPRREHFTKRYRIQEVIKRGQVVLVQIIKEERGNKGAALSTYISLAGRYCVLMPNSAREGGISRKISSGDDRRRLKQLFEEEHFSPTMGVIIRTAGIDRSKTEIKRDYDYLCRVWDQIREDTLHSTAPNLVYEESDLIKRSIRDLYNSTTEEVLVEGESAYRSAKDFMKMIMPSHAPRVKLHKDNVPLFYAYNIEEQLLSMHDPVVRLRSGGYIVINPTEALISIDVNSGRSTAERNIEETATKTNLEAAEEIARQLRLRDLAGLIVIDFIDMNENRHRRQVEKSLKDALKADRARIQLGRISAFGLLEMSRQRLRPSIVESNTIPCPHCEGRGVVRSNESVALQIIRTLEKEASDGVFEELRVTAHPTVTLFLLNAKRDIVSAIEKSFDLHVVFQVNAELMGGAFKIERIRGKHAPQGRPEATRDSESTDRPRRNRRPESVQAEDADAAPRTPVEAEIEENTTDADGQPRRRRRGRRSGRDRIRRDFDANAPIEVRVDDEEAPPPSRESAAVDVDGERVPGRRRGRRGGRGRRRWRDDEEGANVAVLAAEVEASVAPVPEEIAPVQAAEPRPRARTSRRRTVMAATDAPAAEPAGAAPASSSAPRPRTSRSALREVVSVAEDIQPNREPASMPSVDSDVARPSPKPARTPVMVAAPSSLPEPEEAPAGPPRSGWWRRIVEP